MGCINVPAIRFPIASSSVGLVNTFTRGAAENSGRFTCIPLRSRTGKLFVGGHRRHLRQQRPRMRQQRLDRRRIAGQLLQPVDRNRVRPA